MSNDKAERGAKKLMAIQDKKQQAYIKRIQLAEEIK